MLSFGRRCSTPVKFNATVEFRGHKQNFIYSNSKFKVTLKTHAITLNAGTSRLILKRTRLKNLTLHSPCCILSEKIFKLNDHPEWFGIYIYYSWQWRSHLRVRGQSAPPHPSAKKNAKNLGKGENQEKSGKAMVFHFAPRRYGWLRGGTHLEKGYKMCGP